MHVSKTNLVIGQSDDRKWNYFERVRFFPYLLVRLINIESLLLWIKLVDSSPVPFDRFNESE